MKQWIYLTAALAMWITSVSILAITNSQYTGQRVDRVHTYQRTKLVSNYAGPSGTRNSILSLFTQTQPGTGGTPYWDDQNGPGCVGLNYFNGTQNAVCYTKRTQLVTSIKQLMGCDVNKAPVCNCLTAVLRGVAQDNSANSTQGNFTGVGKNLAGYGGYVAWAVDECKWLYRGVFTAVESNSQMVRRTGLLFYLTTVTVFNLLDHVLVPWLLARLDVSSPAYQLAVRALFVLVTLALGLGVSLGIEGQAAAVPCVIGIVPLAILVWYEGLLPRLPSKPWLHPYYFTVSLGCIAVLSLVENGVVDYDNIVSELIKVQMTGFLYMGVVWFYLFERQDAPSDKGYKDIFDSKPVQDSLLITTSLAVGIWINSATAPYDWSPALNYLWLAPEIFVLFAFGGVTWVHSLKLSEFYGGGETTKTRRAYLEQYTGYFSPSHAYFCATHLAIQALVLYYYVTAYTEISLGIITQSTYNSLQLNTSAAWLLPS